MLWKKKVDDYFSDSKHKTTFGVELEMVLYDNISKGLLNDKNVLDDILRRFDKHIYKDFYNWQLEIKTKPHTDLRDGLREIKSLVKQAEKRFSDNDITIIPIPYINGNQRTYCGMHVHLSFPSLSNIDYWKKAMGIYSMLFPILEYSRNCPNNHIGTNERLVNSPHISLPEMERIRFLNNNFKRYDIIYSNSDAGHNYKKMKKPNTVEIRVFDTPSYFDILRYILRTTINIGRYMKTENPIIHSMDKHFYNTRDLLNYCRRYLCSYISSKHQILNEPNKNIHSHLCNKFKVRPPEDKQTNIRTKNKINNIRKYRTLLEDGEWLD